MHARLFGGVVNGVHATLQTERIHLEVSGWRVGVLVRLSAHVQLALLRRRGGSRYDEDQLAVDRRRVEGGGAEDGYVVARRIVLQQLLVSYGFVDVLRESLV